MPELAESCGYQYLQQTKVSRKGMSELRPAIQSAEPFKTYPGAEKIALPRQWDKPPADLWQILQERRSLRRYGPRPLALTELAMLLWASQGITAQSGRYFFRTAPSAGALYPIETYLSVHNVEGVDPGLYHFDVQNFQLELLTSSSCGAALAEAALGQSFLAAAPVGFAWTAVLRRTMGKYGHRGMRYILLDAGHICQNLTMAAEALGCGVCPIAAFFDDEVNALLGVDGTEESVVYMAALGPKGDR